MIMFISCFQNLAKQTNKKSKQKKERNFFSPPEEQGVVIFFFFFDSFSPADLSAGADVQEMFHSLALEGFGVGRAGGRAQGSGGLAQPGLTSSAQSQAWHVPAAPLGRSQQMGKPCPAWKTKHAKLSQWGTH